MKSLIIREVFRTGSGIPDDRLTFRNGVNVIVGRPNTGKTKWLQMLDYAFGSDSQPKDAFGEDMAEKFDRVTVTIEVGGEPIVIERRWKELGIRTKVFVDGESLSERDFSAELLKRLGIPLLHYPQGDPHGRRSWPELSWRSLLRHIYRRQWSWSDLADAQPTSEQHAALLQFLGVAEYLFSDEYGELVGQEKQMWELQAAKEQFLSMLHEVSRELLDEEDRRVALTPESLAEAIRHIREEIAATEAHRNAVLLSLRRSVDPDSQPGDERSLLDQRSDRLAELRTKEVSVTQACADLERRVSELEEYRVTLIEEIGRLQRAQVAGEALAELKVTHCPACDQPIVPRPDANGNCYVCHRPVSASEDGARRIGFEVEQLEGERQEASDLVETLRRDIATHATLLKDIASERRRIETLIRPVQRAVAAILPPEISFLDTRSGQLQERLEQLERVRRTFAKREQLTERIGAIENSIALLEHRVREKGQVADLERASDWLSDGMNDYLNSINKRQPGAWPQDPVAVRLHDRTFDILVGKDKWKTKLGGTLSLYFLIAYHYGLLTLFRNPKCHYPGLVILDFPPVLEDGSSVRDKENFVLEPFVAMANKAEFVDSQIIAAGASFEGLEGAHRIELTRVWSGGATRGGL
jgi:hypothetical protein